MNTQKMGEKHEAIKVLYVALDAMYPEYIGIFDFFTSKHVSKDMLCRVIDVALKLCRNEESLL